MKRQTFLNYFSITLAAMLVGAAALVILGATRHQPAAAQPAAPAPAGDRTLKGKAKQERHFIQTERPTGPGRYAALSGLAGDSTAVIIGTPQTNMSRLTPDGMNITLDYRVKVEYVYKGALREGDLVTVSLPGGMVKFDDGSTAEVRTPGFRKMQDGKTYALFLTPKGGGAFVPTGGAQGVFGIPTNSLTRAVQVHPLVPNDPMFKYHEADVKDFLKELRKSVRKDAGK